MASLMVVILIPIPMEIYLSFVPVTPLTMLLESTPLPFPMLPKPVDPSLASFQQYLVRVPPPNPSFLHAFSDHVARERCIPGAVVGTENTGMNFWNGLPGFLPTFTASPLPLTGASLDPLLFILRHSHHPGRVPLHPWLQYHLCNDGLGLCISGPTFSSELQAHVSDCLLGIFTCWYITILK